MPEPSAAWLPPEGRILPLILSIVRVFFNLWHSNQHVLVFWEHSSLNIASLRIDSLPTNCFCSYLDSTWNRSESNILTFSLVSQRLRPFSRFIQKDAHLFKSLISIIKAEHHKLLFFQSPTTPNASLRKGTRLTSAGPKAPAGEYSRLGSRQAGGAH